eukprot:TRINITY_DN39167_c0_g1_i1.p1 TRINITY_DN39167_c0_g1~~TRINITY_DN39167_c0_g1_i1.p1  ORF type:complete len:642 (+),score=110.43 TRINITY_DN39167_c0_g1_i1:89-2014(+)
MALTAALNLFLLGLAAGDSSACNADGCPEIRPALVQTRTSLHSRTVVQSAKGQIPHFELKTLAGGKVSSLDWEADEQAIYWNLVNPGDTVLSLGGNIGGGCVLVNHILDDPSQQLCVEPNPEIWATLQENKHMTGSSFQILKSVITEKADELRMGLYNDDPKRLGSSVITSTSESTDSVPLTKMSLQSAKSLLRSGRLDTVLADCEGCLCGFLEEHPGVLQEVKRLAFEADGESSQCYQELEKTLRSSGFVFTGCPGTIFRSWERLDQGGSQGPDGLETVAEGSSCGMRAQGRSSLKETFFATLNNSMSARDAPDSYWASYLHQEAPRPRPLEEKVLAHTYWHGNYSSMPALSAKSFLVTQDLNRIRPVLWLDSSTPEITAEMHTLEKHGLEIRLFNFSEEAKGTPFEHVWKKFIRKFEKQQHWPAERTKSDLVRYILLFKHGGLWFDSDVLFLRDLSPLLPYEFAYPWSKRPPGGTPENHTLNAGIMRLFKDSPANLDMMDRVVKEQIPFGLWGLSALRDDTRHPDLRVVDASVFDPLWKHSDYFTSEQQSELISGLDEESPETSRFDWFVESRAQMMRVGLTMLSESRALTYHWHNRWDADPKLGSAFRLYEDFFNCALEGGCAEMARKLKEKPRAEEP